jgi:endonuclease/exonuclease/phosphatase family metal-dependent hydrolase
VPSVILARCRALIALCGVVLLASPAGAIRIVNHNVTNYPGSSAAVRDPRFRTIYGPLGADVLVVQEMISQTGMNDFLTNVLNTLEPGQWSAATFTNGNDTDNALFYKHGKLDLVSQGSFYPNAANLLRLVNWYRLKPKNYTSLQASFWIYSQHLKASTGFEGQREQEAIGIRDSMNMLPAGSHAILLGDFNIYTADEPAFQRFLASLADNDGRVYDPQNVTGDWDNSGSSYAIYHTQCPCLNNCPAGFGFAGGGMDSRFDMFLPTYPMNNGEGLDIVPASYKIIGQDGLHYNNDLNVAPLIPEGQAYADALVGASDHLPIRIDVQVPPRISVVASLAFGTVIVGASANQSLTVGNIAVTPGDELNYSFTPPAGFTAPGGSFTVNAGATSPSHSIGMSTASAGAKAGNLTIPSDDLDFPNKTVSLSGTVLGHAIASLDSASTVTASLLDFGDHDPGMFTDRGARVHNRGYTSLQARLSVTNGVIMGGGGRFSIAGGFSPALLSGIGQSWVVHFDDSGIMNDSTFTGTLTFTSADETLPGALAQPDLVVSLRARVTASTDVAGGIPASTRLHAPYPNPPRAEATMLHFDLATASSVDLAVFDVAGRRVAQVAHGDLAAGRHRLAWEPRDASGRPLAPGVYFIRMTGTGFAQQTTRVTLVR